MIDLSFLTEAEQEAILKVLNRDAELKKAEDERIKHLQDVVENENEFKYKSGQWFYEAKSKRHRDKIHGAELVRASIRKRKKPATIELYGVMEAPDEAEEDLKPTKEEGSQSSKKVSFSSPEKTPDNLRNGTLSPPKPRQNPFNSEGIKDETDFNNEAPSLKPDDVQINGTEKTKSDIMSSLAKYGVKLPYPEPPKRILNSPKSPEENNSQKEDLPVPVPKPRTLRMNGQPQDRSVSPLKRDDSFNSKGKPRGILKRRSSSSSTDSESIRIALSSEPNKIALPGSPIPEAGQSNYFDEQDNSDNSDRLKQVRFSEKVHQRPPSPSPEPYRNKEFGEYGILDPGLSVDLGNGFGDHVGSEDSILNKDPPDGLTKVQEQNAMPEDQRDSTSKQPLSFAMERDQEIPIEDLNKRNDALRLEASTDISIEPPSNDSSDKEPLYAVVKKPPAASSPSQEQDKKPEVGSPDVSNSKPGKPALSETQSDTASSKTDKYEFEVMKAQDESISKVLDWFSRSSEIGDNQPLPVGILQPSKETSSQMLIQTGTNEKESGPNEVILRTGATPYPESPNTPGKLESRLSVISTQTGDHNFNIPNIEHSAPVSLVEEDSVPTGQINLNAEDKSPLQYGKSGGGSGKTLTQEINAVPDNGVLQLAKYREISEKDKGGFDSEIEPKDTLKQNLIHVATEPMSNQEIPEMVEAPRSKVSLSSTEGNNDQPVLKNDELFTEDASLENASPPGLSNPNIEAGTCLEFGKSGGGFGKTPSPSQEIYKEKKPRPSLSSTDTDDEQSDIKNGKLLTEGTSIEKNYGFPPELINSNVEVANCLEFGNSGGGFGKTSSPSQEIFEEKKTRRSFGSTDTDNEQSDIKDELSTEGICVEKNDGSPAGLIKKPRLSLSSTDTDNEQTDIKKDEPLTQTNSIDDISPPRLIHSNVEVGNCLEFGKSGVGSGKTSSPSQEISEDKKPRLSLSSTESTGHVESDTNVDLMTPVHLNEEEFVPPSQINLEAENGGEGSDEMSNQAASNMDPDSQFQEFKTVGDKAEEMLEDEKESVGVLKDEPLIPRVEVRTPNSTEKMKLDGASDQRIENIEDSTRQDAVKSNVQQRRVSDIKQIWEGDKSDLPAAKTVLSSSSRRTFNSSHRPIAPRSSSVESDDQSSPSLVTFKKVMVEEEEENELLPINHLKSFWENGKNKEATNAKPPDSSSIRNGKLESDKASALADSRPKFKKRHTFHSFLEQSTRADKNPPGRSISVSESTNNPKDQQKSTSFQNLRSFWNVDKARSNAVNSNDRAFLDSKNRQFRSNPDLSKESFVAKIKSKLDSQSLEDIREDIPSAYQVQPVKDLYNRKNKAVVLRKFSEEKSDDSSSNSVEVQENAFIRDKTPKFTSVSEETQIPKEKSSSEVSNANDEVSEVVKSSQRPEKVSEFSLRLQKLRDEGSDTTSINSEFDPKNEMVNGDVKNQNWDKMPQEEHERKLLLVKQAAKISADANGSHSLENGNVRDIARNDGLAQVNGEQVHETIEKTLVPPPNLSDFDKGLQKLYNESLKASPVPEDKVSQKEFMNIQSPKENFSKVSTVSSSKERNPSFQQLVVINLSSKNMNLGTGDTGPPGQPPKMAEYDVSETLPKSTTADLQKEVIFGTPTGKQNVTPDEKTEAPVAHQNAKEIVERIEMPSVVPRAPFNYFDQGLKKLYEESRDLTATQAMSNTLQALPAKQDSVIIERASSVSQAPVILEQEIGGTIGKASALTQIYQAKSSERLQKEAESDQEEPFIEKVPSNHATSEESPPRRSEHVVVEGTVSEMSPKGKEAASVEEKVDCLQYEESQESPSKTNSSFTDMRESTPMKEKNNSLRKSTLELYLEVPYRREMSKSMDFELGGYVASDDFKDGYELNSSNPTEDAPVNSFPQNADKLKRLSQSVPAFIQDETDGRDTDSASESSFQIGRHKKSPSSLTNLSGSSGMASMSSVSGSVMSIYSGDFGNVDIKGSIEFSVEYVEQLKEFLIYIYQCKDLAAADAKKQRSDPYVKAYLLPEKAKMGKRKTAVKKKTLNPVYNEILRYKIPKVSLLAQTLNLSVWHHDALGRNSFLGEVNVNLGTWEWSNSHLRRWYPLEPRTPAAGIGLENRGEMRLSLKYVPVSSSGPGTKHTTGEVYIWINECLHLPMLRENKINSFVKCTVLPDTSRKSRQKTRTVDKTASPMFNHTMVYDGFKEEDLREACVELTVWDHNRLSNHFLGGLRIGLGTGKSYGTVVDWMDSTHEETAMWEKMMASPNTFVEGVLPLRMFKMAKLTK